MVYEIVLKEEATVPYDLELHHDNPRSALEVFEALRGRFGDADVIILRDDVQISAAELASDIESYEIRTIMEEECQLPSTYRHGRGGDSDLAIGTDGYQHGVWRPKNPDDDFG
jgi:hypothetical protein